MKTQLDMTKINKIPKNGYNAISLFSGCGGSSLGYKLAGFNILLALEFISKAAEVYRLNHKGTIVLEKDIRETTGQEILDLIGLKKYELDLLDGSPPCSSYSVNGLREAGWGKVKNYSSTKQRVDDLFFEYARIVEDMMPKVIVAENVKGLTLGKAKDVLSEIILTFNKIGYNVKYDVLDASDYGVPQKRERLIFIGVRNDFKIDPILPKPLGTKKITTKEAIEDLLHKGTDQVNNSKRDVLIKKYFPAGTTSKDIKEISKKLGIKVYEQSFRRDKWNEPYYTIKQHHTRPYHPQVDRLMSIWEAMRIQTFPDDFILPHSPTQNWERIGRAVPPELMKHIALCVKNNILDKIE